MRIWHCLFALALLVLPVSAKAIPIETVTSPGGITAWLVQDHSQKVISLNFAIRGGAASDPADKVGLSAFVMSLLDEGAGKYDSGAYQGRLEDLSSSVSFGASADYLTGQLRTLSPTRDEVFELLRLGLTEPHFDPPAVARIRGQLNQMIDGGRQNPDTVATQVWFRTQFPGHPYGRPSIGTKAGLAAVTDDDLRAFVRTRLGRDKLLVAVVGDITPADLGPLLDRTFGGLPAVATGAVVPADTRPAGGGKIILVRKDVPQSVVRFGHEGMPVHDKDFYAALVANRILGGGSLTSRLEVEVREKRGLAYGIATGLVPMDHADLILGQVGTRNAKLAETVDIVRTQWAKFRDEGPTDAELADAKTYLNGSYPLGLDSTGAIAQRLLGLQEEGLGIDYFERRPRMISAVTAEDVRRVLKRWLDPANLSFVVVGNPDGLTPDATAEAPSD